MVELLIILLFTVAISADGFMVGLAYGVRQIHLPLKAILLISLASALALGLSMLCGQTAASLLDPVLARRLGAVLLMLMGLYFLLAFARDRIQQMNDRSQPLWSLNIKALGLIVHVLKDPAAADLDKSGEISVKEALLLGSALALDACGAGIGLALTGAPILFSALAAGVVNFIILKSGVDWGHRITSPRLQAWLSIMSALILLLLGVWILV